jgi:hypothetical protein
MQTSGLHRDALAVAALTLLRVIAEAVVTNSPGTRPNGPAQAVQQLHPIVAAVDDAPRRADS